MDLTKLRDVCKRYSAREYFIEPIPADKARMAKESLQVADSETIVALLDVSTSPGLERAVVITDEGICWRNDQYLTSRSAPHRLSWAQLRQRAVAEKKNSDGKSVTFGLGQEIELSGATSLADRENHLVRDLLVELRALREESVARPAADPPAQLSTKGTSEPNITETKNGLIDLSKLRAVCKRYWAAEYLLEPIPEVQEANARRRLQIGSSEIIVALVDIAPEGATFSREIAITNEGIHWWNAVDESQGRPRQRLSWNQLNRSSIVERQTLLSKTIEFGHGMAMELGSATSLSGSYNHIVKNLLVDLKTLASEFATNESDDAPATRSTMAAPDGAVMVASDSALSLQELHDIGEADALQRASRLQRLRDACNRYRDCAQEYFVEPIPALKLLNARESLNIPATDTIVALIDLTILGGAKEAIVFTDDGLYWKEAILVPSKTLSWDVIRQYTPTEHRGANSKSIRVGASASLPLTRAATFSKAENHVVIELINALRTAAAKSQESRNAEQEDSLTSMVECEFCKGKVKPDVTYCKHCGIKLRG